jgi:DNA polymerase I-like protein with 3'-5' exonuclease and polymerase domains
MSVASLEPNALLAYVERVKASWRETERNKTWEEKIAAIERMREREQQLKQARERVAALRANVV